MLHVDDPSLKSILVELDEDLHAKSTIGDMQELVEQLVTSYHRREFSRRRAADTGQLRDGGLAEDEQTRLLQEIIEKRRARHGITEPKDG